ncbi:hypothetical protein AB0M80_25830 [Amycolatopsis sp. NPDC051045]|uniref:hypothetical protein n=1 Tax=Amycolatopsis sp. NPDC051045 TaxID=3156922 RepID=UPI00341BB205
MIDSASGSSPAPPSKPVVTPLSGRAVLAAAVGTVLVVAAAVPVSGSASPRTGPTRPG